MTLQIVSFRASTVTSIMELSIVSSATLISSLTTSCLTLSAKNVSKSAQLALLMISRIMSVWAALISVRPASIAAPVWHATLLNICSDKLVSLIALLNTLL